VAKIAVLYLPWPGHLNPLCGLARELSRRGHRVAFFHLPEFAGDAQARELEFLPFGMSLQPPLGQRYRALGELEGAQAAACGLGLMRDLAHSTLSWAGPSLEAWKPDLLLVDQMDYGASTLAQILRLPFVTVALTLLKQNEEGVPGFDGQPFQAGVPRPGPLQAFLDELDAVRRSAGLSPFSYETLWSHLAQISQQPPEFEFPRRTLPPWFHFTGPFAARREEKRYPDPDFPWQRLDGRPLVYASLGTSLNRKRALLETIVAATTGLDVQLVLATGLEMENLPEHVVAVPHAPQLEILARADAMITHAGMNSALECLTAGVPMVAMPVAHDQPGVASRIAYTGTGLWLKDDQRTPDHLKDAVTRVLRDDRFRLAAEAMAAAIARADGVSRAAEVVEQVASTGRPVLYGG
jgi:MGT family glycosyltransferase